MKVICMDCGNVLWHADYNPMWMSTKCKKCGRETVLG